MSNISPAHLPPPLRAPASNLRWSIHLALMAALPLLAGFAGASSHREGPALTHTAKGLVIVCGFEVLFFALPFCFAWLASRASMDDLLLRWRPGFWVVPLGAIYSVAIRCGTAIFALIAGAIVVLCTGASTADVQKFAEMNRPQIEKLVDVRSLAENPAYFWLSVILVSFVIGGLREELWRSSFLAGLRSLWPRVFGSRGGEIAGAAVAAIFFGAGHIPQGLLAAALISVVGFLLGLIMVLHRSVWPSVIAHGLFDATSMAVLPWAMQHLQEWQHLQHVSR